MAMADLLWQNGICLSGLAMSVSITPPLTFHSPLSAIIAKWLVVAFDLNGAENADVDVFGYG